MRPSDRIIGENYLHRWYVIPRNRFLNIYLHKFVGSDDDRALHDHPWHSVSFLLKGELGEHTFFGGSYNAWHAQRLHLITFYRRVPRFIPQYRSATLAHRLELESGPAWTLFITGPAIRMWGFICPEGWRHWREFTDESGNRVGRGCE